MSKLLKNIEANVCDNYESKINVGLIYSLVDIEDYINVYGFIGFTQNFKQVYLSDEFKINIPFGLRSDKKIIELNINY